MVQLKLQEKTLDFIRHLLQKLVDNIFLTLNFLSTCFLHSIRLIESILSTNRAISESELAIFIVKFL